VTQVGLYKGDDRFTNVLRALELAGEEVERKIHGKVLVKVNTVVEGNSLANTQSEALRAVLEYLKRFKLEKLWVGEASSSPMDLFCQGDFFRLQGDYNFEFLDFNTTGFDELELRSIEGQPLIAPICKIYRMFDCLISLSVPKAHSDAIMTLSGKNMMGFLKGDEIWKIHGVQEFGRDDNLHECTLTIHRNLRRLLAVVRPDVAVLDAFHSFEAGTVPQCAKGDLVEPRFALAGADFVAVDTVATTALGHKPADIGYLVYCVEDGYGEGDLAKIQIAGTSLAEARFPIKNAPRIERLLQWRA